jgi:hypothetical protein
VLGESATKQNSAGAPAQKATVLSIRNTLSFGLQAKLKTVVEG